MSRSSRSSWHSMHFGERFAARHRLMISALVLAAFLCGCGERPGETPVVPAPANSEPVNLNLWHQWEGQNTKLEQFTNDAIAAYEAGHPDIKITVHSLTGETYKKEIPMKFAEKAEGIDVFYYHVPGYTKRFAEIGGLLPLNEYLTEELLLKLHEGTLQDTSIGDRIYGLPLYSSKYMIYCNRALFEKAGVPLPESFEDLFPAGEALQRIGITPLAVGAQEPWLAAGLYESLVIRQVGAEQVKRMLDGEASICEDPGYRQAAEQVNQLFQEGILGSAPLNKTEYDSMEDFFQGRAAMLFDGTWASRYIDASGMDLDQIAVMDFPAPAGGTYADNYVGGITAGSFFVNQNTEHPDEAADFAIFLTEYLGTRVYESGSGIACWKADQSDISPTLKKIVSGWDSSGQHIPAWDNLLEQKAAETHLTQCQNLLKADLDVDAFLASQDAAITAEHR